MNSDHHRQQLEAHVRTMVDYLRMKLEQRDWHGVADAAMDIRELEAKLDLLRKLERP